MKISAESEFLIIGHRGAAGLAPENTLTSFNKALDLGCAALELDIHPVGSKLAVIHDFELDRTTNRTGRVADLTEAELSQIDAGDDAGIPTLSQVFNAATNHTNPPKLINIEIKGKSSSALLSNFIESYSGGIQILVSSFDHAELIAFRALDSSTPIAPLYDKWQSDWQEMATDLEATAVNLGSRICTEKRIGQIKTAGYSVYVYTVNRVATAKKLAGWGADGVFTDRPDRYLS
ncbi:MAG: glycerophosphoryl diester phosphodiesterase [Limisphaerales bacterium]|jgi:glycerophosphoryl diester phosphodiesterase